MGWFKNKRATLVQAFTLKQVLAIPLVIAVFGMASYAVSALHQLRKGQGEPTLFGVPGWAWAIFAGTILTLYFVIEYADRLRLSLTPSIALSFDQDKEGVSFTISRTQVPNPNAASVSVGLVPASIVVDRRSTYVRFRVDATTKARVRDCAAYITALEKRRPGEANFTPIPLPHPIRLKVFDVLPAVHTMVDFLMCAEDSNRLQSPVEWPLRLMGVFDEPATYRFTFVVNQDNTTNHLQVDVNWQGQWDTITAAPTVPG